MADRVRIFHRILVSDSNPAANAESFDYCLGVAYSYLACCHFDRRGHLSCLDSWLLTFDYVDDNLTDVRRVHVLVRGRFCANEALDLLAYACCRAADGNRN